MIDALIDGLLVKEGWPKFTNDPDDNGGPTKGGITLHTLRAWRKDGSLTADDVEALEEQEVRAIYRHRYITGPSFDRIRNEHLRTAVVDAAVLHGRHRAVRWLQYVTGERMDGVCGPRTLAAVNAALPKNVLSNLTAQRVQFIGRLISNNYKARVKGATDKDQARFAGGWLKRATKFIEG